jgi:hypothetical protein
MEEVQLLQEQLIQEAEVEVVDLIIQLVVVQVDQE